MNEEQRLKMVSALRVVDLAVLGSEFDIFEPIRSLQPDIITLGFDQFMDQAALEDGLKKRGLSAKVIRIKGRDPCGLCSTRRIKAEIIEQMQ
jgi:FAD synthetase